jgi:dTDP-4-dehydrorhamnose 3,5-epimerase
MSGLNQTFLDMPTGLDGLRLLRPRVFSDLRGIFVKTFHADLFQSLGIPFAPCEEFYSISAKGVVRGMHFQLPPKAHSKLVYCVAGRVLDVVIDLRANSPSFQQVFSRELTAASPELLFIPMGFAHGFLALEDRSIMVYQTDQVHIPELDTGIAWNSFGFSWPVRDPVVSDRDQRFPTLKGFSTPF